MNRLTIIKSNYWYKVGEHYTIEGFNEELGFQVSRNNLEDIYYVRTSDCWVIGETPAIIENVENQEKEVLIKLVPNNEGKSVDMPVKLSQGDWIDLRVLTVSQIFTYITMEFDSVDSKYPNLNRSNKTIQLNWTVGIFEAEKVEYISFAKGSFLMLDLSTAIKMPIGYEAYVIPRSSTFKNTRLIQTNSFGLIDNAYCGENDTWKMPVYALEDGFIIQNERICQFRIQKNQPTLKLTQVDNLSIINRGGFGEGTKNEK